MAIQRIFILVIALAAAAMVDATPKQCLRGPEKGNPIINTGNGKCCDKGENNFDCCKSEAGCCNVEQGLVTMPLTCCPPIQTGNGNCCAADDGEEHLGCCVHTAGCCDATLPFVTQTLGCCNGPTESGGVNTGNNQGDNQENNGHDNGNPPNGGDNPFTTVGNGKCCNKDKDNMTCCESEYGCCDAQAGHVSHALACCPSVPQDNGSCCDVKEGEEHLGCCVQAAGCCDAQLPFVEEALGCCNQRENGGNVDGDGPTNDGGDFVGDKKDHKKDDDGYGDDQDLTHKKKGNTEDGTVGEVSNEDGFEEDESLTHKKKQYGEGSKGGDYINEDDNANNDGEDQAPTHKKKGNAEDGTVGEEGYSKDEAPTHKKKHYGEGSMGGGTVDEGDNAGGDEGGNTEGGTVDESDHGDGDGQDEAPIDGDSGNYDDLAYETTTVGDSVESDGVADGYVDGGDY